MPPIRTNQAQGSDDDPGYEVIDDAERDRWNGPRMDRGAAVRLAWYVRTFLASLVVALSTIFGVAASLHPYAEDGTAKTMETHTQLGLPKCNMVQLTGKPCPACGMTTSFSLLVHGDVWSSMKANWVGTLLAAFCLCLIPWAAVGAARGCYLFIRSAELLTTIFVCLLLVLMLGRWAFIWFG